MARVLLMRRSGGDHMTRTLVVYYSRTGTTRTAARQIAHTLGADLEEIEPYTPRSGMLGYLRSAVEASLGRLTGIEPLVYEPEDYDLVAIGSPVWNAALSSPVRTYLAENHARIKRVAFFCTFRHYGSEAVLHQMESLCGKKPTASLVLEDREVARGGAHPSVTRFTKTIREALAPYEPRLVKARSASESAALRWSRA
ncbi:MAG: flavodoxin [Myxococcaceae bacterium]|nr:flavodoxin [Myxococcaceae bacterium]